MGGDAVRERPILFSAPMIRGLLAGTKTQTRRIVKADQALLDSALGIAERWTVDRDVPGVVFPDGLDSMNGIEMKSPYGAAGDRLWVRETFCIASDDPCVHVDGEPEPWRPRGPAGQWAYYRATDSDVITINDPDGKKSPWKPSIFMPRWASRLTLEVTGVRVERLQAITEEDAKAEGVERDTELCDHTRLSCEEIGCMGPTYRSTYAELWMEINGEDSWGANPFVWVVEFKVINAQVGR